MAKSRIIGLQGEIHLAQILTRSGYPTNSQGIEELTCIGLGRSGQTMYQYYFWNEDLGDEGEIDCAVVYVWREPNGELRADW